MSGNGSGSIVSAPNGLRSFCDKRPEHPRMEERSKQDREGDQRPKRRVDVPHPREAHHEDDHARDRGQARLDEDRREHRRRVRHSRRPSERDRARRRRPHAAGQVLREHRDHLGLQRCLVRHVDPPRAEHPDPAEDEDEVVDGDHQRTPAATYAGFACARRGPALCHWSTTAQRTERDRGRRRAPPRSPSSGADAHEKTRSPCGDGRRCLLASRDESARRGGSGGRRR